jgi:ribonuclease HII
LPDNTAGGTVAAMPSARADSPALLDLPTEPTDRFERRARRLGARLVAGLDEAGRGPLAGPVVAAAVVFEGRRFPAGLNDSKKLSPGERQRLYDVIVARAHVSVAVSSRARIDRMNILRASLWAMSRALAGLPCRPDHVLVDGRDLPPGLPCPGEAIIGGDSLSASIAAASIVAKVTRDRLMAAMGRTFPDYGFERHMGYCTASHLDALERHGPCPHHRRSFAPVRIALGIDASDDSLALLPGLDVRDRQAR